MTDGWNIRVTTFDGAGRPVIFRHFRVFETNKDRAIALVRMHPLVRKGDAVEARARVACNEFRGKRMKPGEVKELYL